MRRKTRILWKHWGIWVFKWGAVPVLIIVGTRLVWGLEAGHRLARTEGELRAKHLWLDEAQLRGTPVPDGQNAAAALLKVLDGMTLSSAEAHLVTGGTGDLLTIHRTPADLGIIDHMLGRLQPLWGQLDEAGNYSGAYWPEWFNHSLLNARADNVRSQSWTLGLILLLESQRSHEQGDDVAALRALRRIMIASRIFGSYSSQDGHLAALHLRSAAADGLLHALPTLTLNARTKAEGARLAGMFQEEKVFDAEKVRVLAGGCAEMPGYVRMNWPGVTDSWLMRPLAADATGRFRRQAEALMPDAEAALYPHVADAYDFAQKSAITILTTTISDTLTITGNPSLRFHDRSLVATRAAATLWALRLYEDAHQRYPEALAELVPAYLPQVPVDVFSPTGAALRYRVDEKGPTVWSVGEDGINEGGVPNSFWGRDIVYGAAQSSAANASWIAE